MNSLELRQVECFVNLAHELHFGKSAANLGMTQPHLSRVIKNLEQSLNTSLFERTQRRVTLSEAGKAFLPEAIRLLEQAQRSLEVAQNVVRGETGTLHVGFVLSMAYSVFPKVVQGFRKKHPNIKMTFKELCTADQEQALLEHRLDVSFLYPPLHSQDLRKLSLGSEGLCVALPPNHRAVERKMVSLRDLADSNWILFPRLEGPYLHDYLMQRCRKAKFTPNIVQEVISPQIGLALVAAGVGIYLTFASLEALRLPGVVFRPLDDPFRLELALAWHKDNTSAVLKSFLENISKS